MYNKLGLSDYEFSFPVLSPKWVNGHKRVDKLVGYKQRVRCTRDVPVIKDPGPLPFNTPYLDLAVAVRQSGVCNMHGYRVLVNSDMH